MTVQHLLLLPVLLFAASIVFSLSSMGVVIGLLEHTGGQIHPPGHHGRTGHCRSGEDKPVDARQAMISGGFAVSRILSKDPAPLVHRHQIIL